jgi:site-specific DNA-methyltransferase (adenine-specific)
MGKYDYSYNEIEYKTPKELYTKALNFFKITQFDLDTCCTEHNIPATFYYTKKENGLTSDWMQYNWCNPPFNECKKWVEKAYKEQQKGANIALLIPVRTETAYFHDYILFNPNVHIEWLRKGYCFLDKDNNPMGVFKNALGLFYFKGV